MVTQKVKKKCLSIADSVRLMGFFSHVDRKIIWKTSVNHIENIKRDSKNLSLKTCKFHFSVKQY